MERLQPQDPIQIPFRTGWNTLMPQTKQNDGFILLEPNRCTQMWRWRITSAVPTAKGMAQKPYGEDGCSCEPLCWSVRRKRSALASGSPSTRKWSGQDLLAPTSWSNHPQRSRTPRLGPAGRPGRHTDLVRPVGGPGRLLGPASCPGRRLGRAAQPGRDEG